jgi:hypothetical protein
MYLGLLAAVGLALIAAGAVVVAQIEAEVDEDEELLSHTQTVHARKTLISRFLRLRLLHGKHQHRAIRHQLGMHQHPLRNLVRIPGLALLPKPYLQLLLRLQRLPQALFLMV